MDSLYRSVIINRAAGMSHLLNTRLPENKSFNKQQVN